MQYLKAASCVLSSTTWGAAPLSKASCQRLAQRHQKSPGLRPGKPYCGAGLERSFPLDLVNSRKAWRQHGQVEDREKERIGVSRGIAGKSRVDRGIESLPRAVSSQIFRIRSQPLVSVGSGRSPASSLSTRRAFRSRSHPSCSTHRGRNLSSVPRALSTSEALCQARSASAPHFPCRRRPLRRLSAKVGRRRGMRPPIRAPGGPTRRRRREHRQREAANKRLSCACTFQALRDPAGAVTTSISSTSLRLQAPSPEKKMKVASQVPKMEAKGEEEDTKTKLKDETEGGEARSSRGPGP